MIASTVALACGAHSAIAIDPPAGEQSSHPAHPATYLAGIVDLLGVKWPKNRTVNIVCHGHSVPAGYFKTPIVNTFNAYPHLFHRGLKERFPFAVINIIVTAIGGEAADSGEKRFTRDVLSHKPDLVTIDYALNDRRLGLEKAKAAWKSMIQQAGGVKLLLMTPTPDQSSKLDDPSDPLNQHAQQIRQLADEHKVGLVDSLAAFKQRLAAGAKLADYMAQSNHPNRKGHDLVVAELLNWFAVNA
jgi:lysophospholipase L1-like esterase